MKRLSAVRWVKIGRFLGLGTSLLGLFGADLAHDGRSERRVLVSKSLEERKRRSFHRRTLAVQLQAAELSELPANVLHHFLWGPRTQLFLAPNQQVERDWLARGNLARQRSGAEDGRVAAAPPRDGLGGEPNLAVRGSDRERPATAETAAAVGLGSADARGRPTGTPVDGGPFVAAAERNARGGRSLWPPSGLSRASWGVVLG
ncbi:hypothetical protein BDZ88DRAFT_414882 [Geranomyces variabilis]|nr:hypothetical protein BDZ88DRAFT_414882 [Geranomyces variabilis]